jgi:hypothetical protein
VIKTHQFLRKKTKGLLSKTRERANKRFSGIGGISRPGWGRVGNPPAGSSQAAKDCSGSRNRVAKPGLESERKTMKINSSIFQTMFGVLIAIEGGNALNTRVNAYVNAGTQDPYFC